MGQLAASEPGSARIPTEQEERGAGNRTSHQKEVLADCILGSALVVGEGDRPDDDSQGGRVQNSGLLVGDLGNNCPWGREQHRKEISDQVPAVEVAESEGRTTEVGEDIHLPSLVKRHRCRCENQGADRPGGLEAAVYLAGTGADYNDLALRAVSLALPWLA